MRAASGTSSNRRTETRTPEQTSADTIELQTNKNIQIPTTQPGTSVLQEIMPATTAAGRSRQRMKWTDNINCNQADALGVAGGETRLLCTVDDAEGAQLAVWYKEGHDKPVYTWDSRGKSASLASHWSAPLLGRRAHFSPPTALVLRDLKPEDSGTYRCRIDFQKTPTKNTLVKLKVIIPPSHVEVYDEMNRKVDKKTRAYREGETAHLTCKAYGGEPPANISWWRGGSLISTRSHIEVVAERHRIGEALTCQATNNNMTVPLSTNVYLDMLLKPLWVKIQGPQRHFSAGRPTEINCQSVGARPKPAMSWWKGSTRLKTSRETVSHDGNVTTSILSYTPSINDNGMFLSCRAYQPNLTESLVEDGIKLEVYYVPQVNLVLGDNLNASNIAEGNDVYFDCIVRANPHFYKIQWFHNGKLLTTKQDDNIIISNQSLVMQKINRTRSGVYMCNATNEEGEGRSKMFSLNVRYKPYCRINQQIEYNVARDEEANVSCELYANPLDPVHFTWMFNNSDVLTTTLPATKVIVFDDGTNFVSSKDGKTHYVSSIAKYTPKKSSDYGTLMCIGKNSIGEQITPCVFHILPAGKPDPVSNCTVTNQTKDSLQIRCMEGFNGGLPQKFIVQMYNTNSKFLMKNSTFDFPQFDFTHLPTGTYFYVDIFAFNKKGRSEVFNLQAFTLKEPQRQTIVGGIIMNFQLTPLLWALVAITCLLVFLAILLLLLAKCKQPRRIPNNGQQATKPYPVNADGSNIPLNATDTESVDSLDKSPDILLDGKIADKTSSKLAKLKAANAALHSPDSGKDTIERSPSKQFRDSTNDSFNGQYVQIDPLRYGAQVLNTGRPPVYRMQSGQMYLTNNPTAEDDRRDDSKTNHYDRIYEDMIKFRRSPGTPNAMMPDGMTPSELYINCHPPSQAIYSSIGGGVVGGGSKQSISPVGWYTTTPQNSHHIVNYIGGRQPAIISRCNTPSSSVQTSDKDYLIMAPCQKATIIPKVYTSQPSCTSSMYQSFPRTSMPYDGAPYTMPVSQRVVSPTSGGMSLKYERMSPEETKSLHIRLDPPHLETNRIETGTLKRRISPEMCEMTEDYKAQPSNGSETKLLETSH